MPKTRVQEPLLIVGAGDQARVVLDILETGSLPFRPAGLIDVLQRPEIIGTKVDGVMVIGDLSALPRAQGMGCTKAFVAVGDNLRRKEYTHQVLKHGLSLATLAHPSAQVSPRAVLGAGVIIHHLALVGTGARVEDGAIVNTGAGVDHDCRIGTFAHVAPHAALCGRVVVGDLTLIGVGASVRPGIRIGRRVTVGAGATVVADVDDDLTVVGVPARTLRKK